MKKLMIAFVATVIAVAANAATCSWTGSGVALNGTAPVTNYAIYLLDSSVTTAADMAAALSAGDTSKIAAAKIESTQGIAVGTTSARWSKTGWGDYATGTEVTYYTVIFNDSIASATQYMITEEKTAVAPGTGNLAMGFGAQSSNTWQAMTVPEPTSGLLLLLGMAGLALKRKQA